MENEKVLLDLPLISAHDEVENVRTFVFERKNLQWVAGQSQAFVLPQSGESEKENQHWFTISSAPSEGTVNISTRISASPFKQALNALKPGEKISTHSLGGKFVWEENDEARVTLVAAGIGITPFQKELEDLAQKHPEFQMKLIVGEPVTVEKIFALAPQAREQTVYISGPAPMVSELGTSLKEAGVAIKLDRFPGYDEINF